MTSEVWKGELGRRRHALLMAVIQDFVATAEPVGSQHIVSKYSLGVRAATVRSMMADLETENFLYQPHTSAGRVPTAKAFRYYVDFVMPKRQIGRNDRVQIEFCYSERSRDLTEVMRDTSRLLALLTGQAAVVLPPRFEAVELKRVNFILLREAQVMAVFIAIGGEVQTRIVDSGRDYTQDELERMANYLNECLEGRTLEQARAWIESALKEDRTRYDRFIRDALTLGDAVVSRPVPVEVYVEGSAKALQQPEFSDPGKLKELLGALEDKSALLDLLERTLKVGSLEVSIGAEHDPRLSDLSVVAAAYSKGTMRIGSLGVVGPVRMDYERVIALVDYTARALSRVLES
ncbi:MAG: heat-inducible transcriptional repressor HrcA [Candidatus Binataceae bacterium]